jgi:EAL domain-containing protein (putative c-di-GMP-specific phosphodiesterase class I)
MLNSLPHSHLDQQLFLDVDPRHILGIKQDHGAYFEEVIVTCGLQTKNVTIALTVKNQYADFIPSLLKGLHNYRRRGYQLALNFDFNSLDKLAHQLVRRSSPEYVGLSVAHMAKLNDQKILEKFQSLNRLTSLIDTRSILYGIDHQHIASLASWMGFDWVHGEYFEQPFVKNAFYRPIQNATASGSDSKIRR